METKKFKTNAKCGGCVAKIAEVLDGEIKRDQWSMDLNQPEKTLTITTDLSDNEIVSLIQKAGFKAERI
ncbi:MAG: cation transporter [Bacteroidales bacterium]|nr:cation transporter [Bacteroidales bacterium]